MWTENFGKCSANSSAISANSSAISLSHFARGPGSVEYERTGGDGDVVLGVSLIVCRFPRRGIFPVQIRDIFSKGSFRISWSLDLSLLRVRLYVLLLSCV